MRWVIHLGILMLGVVIDNEQHPIIIVCKEDCCVALVALRFPFYTK